MPAQLKHAWFDLITGLAVIFAYVALAPFVGPERAFAAFALAAIGALGPIFYRKPKDSAAVLTDERDQSIHLRSLAVSWAVLWLFFVGFCMITWQLHRGGMVRAELFPAMVGVGYVVVMISRALATVLLYRMQGA